MEMIIQVFSDNSTWLKNMQGQTAKSLKDTVVSYI